MIQEKKETRRETGEEPRVKRAKREEIRERTEGIREQREDCR